MTALAIIGVIELILLFFLSKKRETIIIQTDSVVPTDLTISTISDHSKDSNNLNDSISSTEELINSEKTILSEQFEQTDSTILKNSTIKNETKICHPNYLLYKGECKPWAFCAEYQGDFSSEEIHLYNEDIKNLIAIKINDEFLEPISYFKFNETRSTIEVFYYFLYKRFYNYKYERNVFWLCLITIYIF